MSVRLPENKGIFMPDDSIPVNKKLSDEDRDIFRQAVAGARQLAPHDQAMPTTLPPKPKSTAGKTRAKRAAATGARAQATHPFSSQFEPALPQGTMKYTATGANPYLVKQLRRGDFPPDLIVDLHGLTQIQAQRDLAAAITQCKQAQSTCLNVIHGVGTGVLRSRVPGWLMQHPDVLAFHQAPLEWGGQGALLVLLKTDL